MSPQLTVEFDWGKGSYTYVMDAVPRVGERVQIVIRRMAERSTVSGTVAVVQWTISEREQDVRILLSNTKITNNRP